MRKLFLEIAFFLVLALILSLLFNTLSPNSIKLILPKIFSGQPAASDLFCGAGSLGFTVARAMSL